jgi:hypothetical protein
MLAYIYPFHHPLSDPEALPPTAPAPPPPPDPILDHYAAVESPPALPNPNVPETSWCDVDFLFHLLMEDLEHIYQLHLLILLENQLSPKVPVILLTPPPFAVKQLLNLYLRTSSCSCQIHCSTSSYN